MTVGPDIFDEFEAYRFSDDPDFRVSTMSQSMSDELEALVCGADDDRLVSLLSLLLYVERIDRQIKLTR